MNRLRRVSEAVVFPDFGSGRGKVRAGDGQSVSDQSVAHWNDPGAKDDRSRRRLKSVTKPRLRPFNPCELLRRPPLLQAKRADRGSAALSKP